MRTVSVEHQQIADRHLADSFAVQRIVMIGLEITVERDLPPRAFQFALVEDAPAVEFQGAELGGEIAQPAIDIERLAGGEFDVDQARAFGAVELRQTQLAVIDVAKRLGRIATHQGALLVIGPGVIGTGEDPCMAGPRTADPGAAVAAGVQEGARHAVLAAHDQYRHVEDLHGAIVAGIRDLDAQGQCLWQMFEYPLDFALIAIGIDIGRYRHGHGRVRLIGGAVAEMSDGASRQAQHFVVSIHVHCSLKGA